MATDGATPPATTPPAGERAPLRGALLLLGVYSVVAAVIIVSQRIPYRAAFDQKLYHLPVIREFVRTWPVFDTWDYLSATTPLYHILMAAVARVCGPSPVPLQVATAAMTGVLLWLLARDASRRLPAALAAAVCLPIIASPYSLFPAVFILPDNLGWLGVVAVLLIAMNRMTPGRLGLGAVVLLLLVLTRQVHIWAAGLLWVSAWLSIDPPERSSWAGGMCSHAWSRTAHALGAVAVTVPAMLALYGFVRYWGGLVPHRFAEQIPPADLSRIVRSAAAPLLLSMLGAYSVFFAGFLWRPLLSLWRSHRAVLVGAACLGLVLALVPPTTADFDAGRRGVLWSVGMKGPVIAGRTSVLVVGTTMFGAVCAAAWLSACQRRDRAVLLAAMVGFAASQLPSLQLWHRYFDPFVFFLLVLFASRAGGPGGGRGTHAVRLAGPAVLAAGLLVYSGTMFFETGLHAAQRMGDPAPPSKDPEGLHHGIDPPVDKPPTPKPAGRRFFAPW